MLSSLHFHVCENCRHDWCHDRRDGMTPEEHRKYHLCPKCGSGPYRFAYESVMDAMKVAKMLRSEEPGPSVFE